MGLPGHAAQRKASKRYASLSLPFVKCYCRVKCCSLLGYPVWEPHALGCVTPSEPHLGAGVDKPVGAPYITSNR
jgi:hypothetical protein